MKKQRNHRGSRRGARRGGPPKKQRAPRIPAGPVQIVSGYDGRPVEDCACPICAELAHSGVKSYELGPDGELLERRPGPRPPMIEVTVHGTASTWPHLPLEGRAVSVPVGTVVADLLEYVAYRDTELRIAFPPGTMHAAIDGEPCEPGQVVRAGDVFAVSGVRDPELSRLMAAILK